jgi:beta-mannanase
MFLAGGNSLGLSQPMDVPPAEASSISGCYLGVFREGAPQNMAYITSFEKTFNKKPSMVMWYTDYSSDFPAKDCKSVYAYGAVPQIVWQPWIWGDEEKIKLDNIINGEWDGYIEKWARDAAAFKKTIFIRWGHEFNLEKYPWGVGNNNKSPEKYIKAYRRVHDIFTKAGANNIKWVWCFNNYPSPNASWNSWDQAYPGDEYVDWIGIDGYNWGTSQTWSGWQSFKEMFRDQIREASKKYPGKPVMIAEFGSAEEGGDKAQWIKEIPSGLKTSMPQVKAIVLFDLKKECDWRATSCLKTEDAYRAIFKDKYFLSSMEGLAEISTEKISAEKSAAIAKKTPVPIVIDGNFAPFAGAAPIIMDSDAFLKEGTGWSGPKDLNAKIYLMWDREFMYLYAKVTDNFPMVNSRTKGDIWNGDAIEMVIPNYQIGFGTGDGMANKPSIWIWQKNRNSSGKIMVKKSFDPTGYVLEAKVPWSEIATIAPKTGDTMAFDIAVDDADQTWERKIQFVWSGDYLYYKDPDVWGVLKFEE